MYSHYLTLHFHVGNPSYCYCYHCHHDSHQYWCSSDTNIPVHISAFSFCIHISSFYILSCSCNLWLSIQRYPLLILLYFRGFPVYDVLSIILKCPSIAFRNWKETKNICLVELLPHLAYPTWSFLVVPKLCTVCVAVAARMLDCTWTQLASYDTILHIKMVQGYL